MRIDGDNMWQFFGPWIARMVNTNVEVKHILWIDDHAAQYGQVELPVRVDENCELVTRVVQAKRIVFDYDRRIATIYP